MLLVLVLHHFTSFQRLHVIFATQCASRLGGLQVAPGEPDVLGLTSVFILLHQHELLLGLPNVWLGPGLRVLLVLSESACG